MISLFSIISTMRSLLHLHPFLGGFMIVPLEVTISKVRFILGFGEDTLPENHGPLGSLSGFL